MLAPFPGPAGCGSRQVAAAPGIWLLLQAAGSRQVAVTPGMRPWLEEGRCGSKQVVVITRKYIIPGNPKDPKLSANLPRIVNHKTNAF